MIRQHQILPVSQPCRPVQCNAPLPWCEKLKVQYIYHPPSDSHEQGIESQLPRFSCADLFDAMHSQCDSHEVC